MSTTAVLLAATIVLPAAALVAWAWWAMAEVDAEMRSFDRIEGLQFEIGPSAADAAADGPGAAARTAAR